MNRKEMSLDELNASNQGTLMEALGIRYTLVEKERVEAVMEVNNCTRQPFGILHGGATLALAETVAGMASYMNCADGQVALGMQVSCNHVSSAAEGEQVKAVATPIHLGRSTHVWNIDVCSADGRLVSTVRLTNYILSPKESGE